MNRKKIEFTALGYDPDFGGLDLTGCPSVAAESIDSNFIDERFAPLDTSGSGVGSRALKDFIGKQLNPDQSASTVYVSNAPFEVYFEDQRWHGKGKLGDNSHHLTAPDRDSLIGKLMKLVANTPRIRDLTEDELLHVTRLAQAGDETNAFAQYFISRIGPHVGEMADPVQDLLCDPRYYDVCNDGAFLIWAAGNDGYIPDEDFEELVRRVGRLKPLNGRLLSSLWIRFLDERQTATKSTSAVEPEVAPTSFENMSDDEIESALRDTKHLYAREVRAGRA